MSKHRMHLEKRYVRSVRKLQYEINEKHKRVSRCLVQLVPSVTAYRLSVVTPHWRKALAPRFPLTFCKALSCAVHNKCINKRNMAKSYQYAFLIFLSYTSHCISIKFGTAMYIGRLTRCTISYNESLLIIKRSTCFGLFSPSSGVTFYP